MRRNHALVLCLIAAVLLSGCALGAGPASPSPSAPDNSSSGATPGNGASSGGQGTTVTFAAFDEEKPIYEPLIAKFEQENPGIHIQLVSASSLFPAVPSEADQQDPNSWIRYLLSGADTVATVYNSAAIKRGWVRDLRPLMDADASFNRTDFYPGVLESVNQGTSAYLLPRSLNLQLLSYNKALWSAAGLKTPGPDFSWTDLMAAAEQLTKKRGNDVDVHGLVAWNTSLSVARGELANAGVDLATTRLDQLHLEDPTFQAAVERAATLTKSGVLFLGNSPDDDRQQILDQKVAIWPAETPYFGKPDTKLPFEIGSFVFPTQPAHLEGYYISSGAKQPEAAWRWIAFLSQQPITYKLGDANVDTQVPVRPSIIEKSDFWKQFDPDTAASLQTVFTRPLPPLVDDIDERLNGLLSEAVDAVVQGSKSPQQALHDAQASLDQIALQPTAEPAPGPVAVATPVPAAPAGAVTIRFGAPAFSLEPLRRLVANFNKDNPQIVVDFQDTNALPGATTIGAVAQQTDCFADFDPPTAADAPNLLDLQPLIDADPTFQPSDYQPQLLAPFRSGNKLYGLPDEIYYQVLFYNPALFDAAGLSYPTSAWTFDEMLHAATQLTRGSGATKQYGYAMLGDSTGDQTQDVLFFMDRLKASLTKGTGDTLQPNFSDPAVVAAARSYVDLLRTTSPHTQLHGYRPDTQPSDTAGLIARQQVGMWVFYGTSLVSQRLSFKTAISAPPLGGNPVSANAFQVRALYISAKTTQQQACWEWIKFVSHNIAGLGWGVPARTSVANSDAFVKQAPEGATEVYKVFREALDRTSTEDSSANALSPAAIDYYWFYQALDRALQGQDLQRELDNAQKLTEQYLACVRGGTPGGACATQTDPDYKGTQNAAPAAP